MRAAGFPGDRVLEPRPAPHCSILVVQFWSAVLVARRNILLRVGGCGRCFARFQPSFTLCERLLRVLQIYREIRDTNWEEEQALKHGGRRPAKPRSPGRAGDRSPSMCCSLTVRA